MALQIITGSCEGDNSQAELPAICTAAQVSHAHQIRSHRHIRGQLIYSRSGPLQVHIQRQHYHLPVGTAIWIPAMLEHAIEAAQQAHYRCCFILGLIPELPTGSFITLSPLLGNLIETACEFRDQYKAQSAEQRLANVICDQIVSTPRQKLQLTIPSDRFLQIICRQLLNFPTREHTLEYWSTRLPVSARHLNRKFRRYTPYSYLQWQQRAQVLYCQQQLARGQTCTRIALDLGYSSPSAFTAMYKRLTGETPRQSVHNSIVLD